MRSLKLVALAAIAVAVLAGPASALDQSSGTDEQRSACRNDAMRLCMSHGIDVDFIAHCLATTPEKTKTHDGVSHACKAAMKKG